MAAEDVRQAMLRQMGIRPWFRRTSLPGAGLSHQYQLSGSADEAAQSAPEAGRLPAIEPQQTSQSAREPLLQSTPRPLSRPADQAVPAVIPAALRESLSASESVAQKAVMTPAATETPSPDAQEHHQEQVQDFGFSWFSLDKRLAVLAMLPPGAEGINRPCRTMLQRILGALSDDFKASPLTESSFHWPFPDDLGLPSDAEAARHAADGFIARRLREQAAAMLLVLADEPPAFLRQTGKAVDDRESGALTVHRQFGFAMLRTHSLHAMEANPELKRSAWQAMQVLLERLNRKTE